MQVIKNQKSKIKNYSQVHCAAWIIPDSKTIIQNGCLLAEKGLIKGIYSSRPKDISSSSCIDHGPGVIIPALVNAHLHLELSALKDQVPMDKGFQAWVAALLKKREDMGKKRLIQGAKQAITDLKLTGNLYIGEISTLGITKTLLENSGIAGVFFQEYLGEAVPDKTDLQKSSVLSKSLAGHAPHTTAPKLLKSLKQQSLKQGLPFSIHTAESEAEIEFIDKKKGDWADFLTLRGIDYKSWEIGSVSPTAYLKKLGILDKHTLTVHLLHTTKKDMDIICETGSKVCLCPRSNQNLHNRLPDIETMIQKGIEPALGTDSLASADSLDIKDEMAFTARAFPKLKPEIIFNMATDYGAKALGLEQRTGTLRPGKHADFIYLPIQVNNKAVRVNNKKEIFEQIIFGC